MRHPLSVRSLLVSILVVLNVFLALEDTITIMLATDNHIGYLERDPVRGQDAINTFEEILQLAVEYEVCQLYSY